MTYTIVPDTDGYPLLINLNLGIPQRFSCNASDNTLPQWYVNGIKAIASDYSNINGSWYTYFNISPTIPMEKTNVKCGNYNGTVFSNDVNLIAIRSEWKCRIE